MGINQIAIAFGGGIVGVRVSMAKPWAVRAELPKAPDLFVDPPILRGGSSSSRRRDLVFVVNPKGANGKTGKEWKKLLPYLRSRLCTDCNGMRSLVQSKVQLLLGSKAVRALFTLPMGLRSTATGNERRDVVHLVQA